MRKLFLALTALASLTMASGTVLAGGYGYSTPRFGGGYNYYGNDGTSGYTTPRFDGGYNYYGNDGTSGYATPRFGGGYNYYSNRPNYFGN